MSDDLGPWPEKVYLLHPSIKSFGALVTNPERREYVLADRIEEVERERNDLLSFDDYFRALCGFKRDSRDSKECLDEFLAELKRQDVIVPFDHLLTVARERNEAEAKLAKAVEALREIKSVECVHCTDYFHELADAVLAELEGGGERDQKQGG